MDPIITFYANHFETELSGTEQEMVLALYKRKFYPKKTILFKAGDANTKHYLIEKGLLRLFLIDSRGKEINILFAKENQALGDLSTPNTTNFYLETLEDSWIHSIDEDGLQQVMETLQIWKAMSPKNGLRRAYIHIQKRLVSILSKSAEENYLEFRNQYPDLIQRLPQYQIAAYLGISPEFLSKIIAKTSKNS